MSHIANHCQEKRMVEYCDSLEDRPGRLYSTVSLVSGPAKRSEHVFKIKK